MPSRTTTLYVLALLAAAWLLAGGPGRGLSTPAALPGVIVGRAAVLVAFQQSDCRWTSASLPDVVAVADSGLAVIGLLIGERDSAAAAQLGIRLGLPYPLLADRRRRAERYLIRLGYTATPIILAVDAAGRVRQASQWDEQHGSRLLEETFRIAASLHTPLLPMTQR
jgi:hypothetical protein